MLDRISLINFKGFKELKDLNLKPITVLCGTNSSGKSSILQSILLLKQTLESQNPSQTLLLNGRFVHLGAFENIVFRKNLENTVVLDLSFTFTKNEFTHPRGRHRIPIALFLRELVSQQSYDVKDARYQIRYKISLKAASEPATRRQIKQIVVDEMNLAATTILADGSVRPEATVTIKHRDGDSYTLRWANVMLRYMGRQERSERSEGEFITDISFANLLPIAIRVPDDAAEGKRPPDVIFLCYRLTDMLQAILAAYTYLGPLREEPSRRYIYEDEIVEIGMKGENAAYIYLTEQDAPVENHYFFDAETETFRERKATKLSLAVKDWLNLMNIRELRPEPTNEIIYLNLNAARSDRTRVNIADVGFGVSQIFPIVLEGLRMPKGNTLLLEQPEIHLHPNLQMQLADYFIALALSQKRVIVETHSDHIINRLIHRIVEGANDSLARLTAIYFIKQADSGGTFETVDIDPTRGIVNWPTDFFDQTATEQEKIIRAGLKKRKESGVSR